MPFNKIEIIVNGEVAAHDEPSGDGGALPVRHLVVELPIKQSSWVALRVRGPESPTVFDGPAWAHTSPVYIKVAGRPITSQKDARYFVDWIDQMIRVVEARNRFSRGDDRHQVESLFRRAQDEFRKLAAP